ncbi:unnamed protein product [Dimorphilus gyrociliatus]|uniref:Uncharacterized protein n=1 Tax=Dimorphilus gyrociliatus TaxID=2664684 RepID=A0A7I8W5H9_9ANNE|nr:unnamed protein product [Dimorphilus gyrociliatus]
MSNYRLLRREVEDSEKRIEIKVYRTTRGVRHVGFAVFIDDKWRYTLDYGPADYILGIIGSRAQIKVNIMSDKPTDVKTAGIQYLYTRNEPNWKQKALSKIDELLQPTNEIYKLFSTNCSNEVRQKINKDDPGGNQILKEAETIQSGLIVGGAVGCAIVVGVSALVSRHLKKDKEKERETRY